jgi:hypothetical protein
MIWYDPSAFQVLVLLLLDYLFPPPPLCLEEQTRGELETKAMHGWEA